MMVFALLGSKALYLLFIWLVSAAGAAWLADRKGYGERLGLTFGLLLTALGLLIVLLLPGRPGSRWREEGWLPRRTRAGALTGGGGLAGGASAPSQPHPPTENEPPPAAPADGPPPG